MCVWTYLLLCWIYRVSNSLLSVDVCLFIDGSCFKQRLGLWLFGSFFLFRFILVFFSGGIFMFSSACVFLWFHIYGLVFNDSTHFYLRVQWNTDRQTLRCMNSRHRCLIQYCLSIWDVIFNILMVKHWPNIDLIIF